MKMAILDVLVLWRTSNAIIDLPGKVPKFDVVHVNIAHIFVIDPYSLVAQV
jgi:hypothetical protein